MDNPVFEQRFQKLTEAESKGPKYIDKKEEARTYKALRNAVGLGATGIIGLSYAETRHEGLPITHDTIMQYAAALGIAYTLSGALELARRVTVVEARKLAAEVLALCRADPAVPIPPWLQAEVDSDQRLRA